MNSKITLLVFIACIFLSCEKMLYDENTSNDAIKNFNVFWKEFDLNYSYFEYKNVNWDSIYNEYRPLVTNSTTDVELFNLLGQMTLHLRDGHVNIISPFGFKFYNYQKNNAPTVNCIGDSAQRKYFENLKYPNSVLSYAVIKNRNIGYIKIVSFGNPYSHYTFIDHIIRGFEATDGIIVDLRNNGGGSDINSREVVSRFTDKKRLYRKYRYRNGPNHNEFTPWIDEYIEPSGNQYLKPVVVLTNKACFSATEDCILAFKVLPNVRIVGDTTGGGSGNPIVRELPNGWLYRLSNWQEVDTRMAFIEGKGIPPDSVVWISKQDSINGTDRILEVAIQMIEKE